MTCDGKEKEKLMNLQISLFPPLQDLGTGFFCGQLSPVPLSNWFPVAAVLLPAGLELSFNVGRG